MSVPSGKDDLSSNSLRAATSSGSSLYGLLVGPPKDV